MASFSPIPSYLFGTVFTVFGLLPFLSAEKDYEVFGFPLNTPSTRSDRNTVPVSGEIAVSPYVYAKGVRDITYGLAYILFQAQGEEAAITTFSAIVCLTAVTDGVLVLKHGGQELKGKAWGHISTAVVLAAWAGWRSM